MCGIAGIWNKNKEPVNQQMIEAVSMSLQHRGPDGAGVWKSEDESLALVHRRLTILDLSDAAAQPMKYADDRFVIVFNGEIYNFIEIKKELDKKGYNFRTESDTEVILAAYTEWGENMLHRFNGMWAFAIYDQREKKLFLSRDRYSIKPLYYYADENTFAFASEVQALKKILGKKAEPDEVVLKDISNANFFHHGTNRTYLKNVFSLPGGYNLNAEKNKIRINKWYDLQKQEIPKSFNEQSLFLRDLIFDSCKLRLRSDVPIATSLSGGVDSGSIAVLIHEINKQGSEKRFNHYSHESFLASFPGSVIDERNEAEKLAAQVGNNLNVVNITPPSVDELESAMNTCDGPMHSLAFYPISLLYKHIKSKGIKVTLDGQGPDEMLGGYRPLHAALMSAFRQNKLSWAIDVYKTYAAQGESAQFSSAKFAQDALRFVMKKKLKRNLRGQRLKFMDVNYPVGLDPVRNEILFDDALNHSLYQQFFFNPLPAILNQYDRCSMAHGVECRMPFMDYRIVEYIFSLPAEAKVGGGYTKRILREAMKDILPDSTRLNKTKIGFNAPVVEWFRGPLKIYMLDIMNSKTFLECKYFSGNKIKGDYELFLKGAKGSYDFDVAFKFWPPVHIAWWLNKNKLS